MESQAVDQPSVSRRREDAPTLEQGFDSGDDRYEADDDEKHVRRHIVGEDESSRGKGS